MPCLSAYLSPIRAAFVMPFFDLGSLMDVIQKYKSKLTDDLTFKIAFEVAKACNFLHSLGILHRDLTLANIMVR
jgi:serine/threonine protein kinase